MRHRRLRRLAKRFGYEIIPTWRLERLRQSMFLERVFARYRVDLVVDVGANIGQTRDYLRNHVAYEGSILSFEPNPQCFRVLRQRAENDRSWSAFEYAMGREDGFSYLNVMSDDKLSSFRRPLVDEVPMFEGKNVIAETTKVTTKRLDSVWQEHELYKYSAPFLKLDTQGFDLEVLAGAGSRRDDLVGVQTEASVIPLYESMPPLDETVSRLKSWGFTLSDASVVSRDDTMRAIEFDLVFLNDHKARRLMESGAPKPVVD